jgi:tetratricopeptide (TPR) repeat protein
MCVINFWFKWNYVSVYETALRYESYLRSDSLLMEGLANFYLEMGLPDEAISFIGKDQTMAIKAHMLLGNTSYARELFRRRNVSDELSPFWLELYIWLQEFDSALNYLKSYMESGISSMQPTRFQADLALVYHKTGHTDKARNIIGKIIQRSDTTASQSPAYFLGWYYGWIGEPDSAFYWLEKAVENRSPEIPWLKVDPAFESLKEDPRYCDLYERTGHKAFDDYMAGRNQ